MWTNASQHHLISKGYPCRSNSPPSLSISSLVRNTLSAYNLANRWLSGITSPHKKTYITGTSGTSVSHVRFLPGHSDYLLTISKTVWSAVSIWDMRRKESKKVGEWSPRGAIFNAFAVNSDENSEATLAVSVHLDGWVLQYLLVHFTDHLQGTFSQNSPDRRSSRLVLSL